LSETWDCFSRRFPFNPSPENLALFKVPAAIMNSLFSAEAVYADNKAIIRRGFDKGANVFPASNAAGSFTSLCSPFWLILLLLSWTPVILLNNYMSRVVPEWPGPVHSLGCRPYTHENIRETKI
jgi:hypothetical protein